MAVLLSLALPGLKNRAWVMGCAAMLTGCANLSQHEFKFETQTASIEIPFEVIDQREEASRKFRSPEGSYALYEYGDDQFVPGRIYFLASHFAAAWPRAPATTTLVIDRFDITNHMPRPSGDAKPGHMSGAEAIIVALAYLVSKAIQSPEVNHVSCRIAGSFGGIPFDVTHQTRYDGPLSAQFLKAMNAAMLSATTKAIAEVRRSAPARGPGPGIDDRTEAPRPVE